jgi:uncharacterized protein (TIGR03905 family)
VAIYKTKGVCSSIIEFEVVDGVLRSVNFEDGCDGNLTGISRLVEGMKVEEVIQKLKGIPCQGNTSCPDQLARALEEYMAGLTAYESAMEEAAVAE